MAEQSRNIPHSRDLNEIAEQTQPSALRLLDNAALGALLRGLRQMKAAEQDQGIQKTLAQAIRRAAAERRARQASVVQPAESDPAPKEKPGKAEKAEEKARRIAERAEKKRVKVAERAEKKAAKDAEKALPKAGNAALKPGKSKGTGKNRNGNKGNGGKNSAAKPTGA